MERHGFEYDRHGTPSLLAACNTKTGTVRGQPVPRHTSAEFVAFLGQVVAHEPEGREIRIVLDNLATHTTQRVRDLLAEHPNVQVHFAPTSSSWLNHVELWFARIERDVIARGVFTSSTDLARKLMRDIRRSNQTPKPIRWNYSNPSRRIPTLGSTSTVTRH